MFGPNWKNYSIGHWIDQPMEPFISPFLIGDVVIDVNGHLGKVLAVRPDGHFEVNYASFGGVSVTARQALSHVDLDSWVFEEIR